MTKASISESVEIPLGFSVLRNSEFCRASRTLSTSTLSGAQICFSTHAWNQWLNLSPSEEDLTRLHLTGKWELRVSEHGEQRVFKVDALKTRRYSAGFFKRVQQSCVQGIERERMRLSEAYARSDYLGVFRRLILDERPSSEFSEQHELMRELGFVHLLTPSGLHLYALARWIFFLSQALVFFLGFRFTVVHRVAGSVTLMVVVWSWAFTGFRWGLLRPLLMIAVSEAAKKMGFKFRKGTSLFLAIAVDVLFELFLAWNGAATSFAMGRLHYILAVGGGLLAIEESDRTSVGRTFFSEFQLHVRLAFGSWITTALYDGFLHSGVSLATPVLSLITVPVLGSWVYPMLIGQSFQNPFFSASDTGIRFLSGLLEAICDFIFKNPIYFWIPPWAFLAGACLAALSFLFNKRCAFYLVLILILTSVLLRHLESIPHDSAFTAALNVEQLNIGQGDAALVTMREKNGNSHFGFVDTGSIRAKTLVSWLRIFSERGILNLDFVALTHLDEDHAGALAKIIDLIPVKCVVTSEKQWSNARGQKLAMKLKAARVPPVDWKSGCFPFPHKEPVSMIRTEATKFSRPNENMSAVWIPVRAENRSFDYVSLGDAHVSDELKFIPWLLKQKTQVPVVFKVSHHGSHTSTSERLLDELQPAEAWISFGAGNRYGHPTLQTLEKLRKRNIPIKTTVGQTIRWGPLSKE